MGKLQGYDPTFPHKGDSVSGVINVPAPTPSREPSFGELIQDIDYTANRISSKLARIESMLFGIGEAPDDASGTSSIESIASNTRLTLSIVENRLEHLLHRISGE